MSESVGKTICVAVALCVVCSFGVSASVVVLKPKQDINRDVDFKKNILEAAGLLKPGVQNDIAQIFKNVETVVVELESGSVSSEFTPENFVQARADKDPRFVEALGPNDPAGIRRRARLQTAYLVRDASGRIDQVVVRVYGRGLWSTMYGFLAIDKDGETIRGFSYYSHGETPGLGGEVDNPRWKRQWVGKKVFDRDFNSAIQVVKGRASPGSPHEVDGLAGATLTSKGVQGTFDFWMSDRGYRAFLSRVKSGGIR